ncbi:MAG: GNAT family N-acetyltransferase [Pseudorhodoplanes sp.]|uniref:GNAT family N-acetyltransferase n=1 Tax=Pseudorhodoplanes sp. TaxID=1934341 RepID=UPI003D0ABA61
MAFFRSIQLSETHPVVPGDGVYLRAPQMSDFPTWSTLREKSRDFLVPWEPTWPEDDLTRSSFRRRLRRYAEDMRCDQAYAFLLFRRDDNALLGGITLTNVRRGVAQAASMGYWVGAPFASQGYMTRGVSALVPFAFDVLRLHRVEAACIPSNQPSIRLLERTGFQREGYAREYLCINGMWQDHLLYAQVRGD